MAYFDMPIDELYSYTPERHEELDFDEFWDKTLSEARAKPLDARFEKADFNR